MATECCAEFCCSERHQVQSLPLQICILKLKITFLLTNGAVVEMGIDVTHGVGFL